MGESNTFVSAYRVYLGTYNSIALTHQNAFFRLVYDRETGKPKGYGFCEYQDIETAQSALRNLNNTDFNGRPLRVGVAAGEQNKDDMAGMQQALGGPVIEVNESFSQRNGKNISTFVRLRILCRLM